MEQTAASGVSNGAGKVKEPILISPGGARTEEKHMYSVTNQNDMSQDDQPRGEVNMEASISAEDVIRAGGFGAKDDIGSFLPVASDSTDFEESLRSARDYEEAQPEVRRPGLGWPKELKTSLGMRSDLSVHEVFNNDDTMSEILLLLPPETIYKLILVSKRWLQIISSPFFRHTYLIKWKPSFQLIGFFICNSVYLGRRVEGVRRPRSEPSLPLLSTSSFGDEIESSGILQKLGYYIDSSNGLLLCGCHPKAYYLWDPSTRKQQQLPRPRVHFEQLCVSLITEDCPNKGFSYKVIRAECVGFAAHSTKLKVEAFSSKTTTWSYSELTCAEPISLSSWNPGRAIGGMVYWHATGGKIAIYDSNSEEKRINVIKLPKTYGYDEHVLGESADGCLQYGWSTKSVMEIWKLEKVNDVLQWNILLKLNFKKIWRMNPEVATRFSTRTKETQLLAFLNQKSDLVYIRCETQIFIYDTETQRVEVVQYQGRGSLLVWDFCKVVPYFRRTWPSSPTPQCNASSSGSITK